MATMTEIAELRINISEPDDDSYSDAMLSDMIDAYGMNGAAARVWGSKASAYSEMVDISEAGSSRRNSQLMSNALRMSGHYDDLAGQESGATAGRVMIGKIVRD